MRVSLLRGVLYSSSGKGIDMNKSYQELSKEARFLLALSNTESLVLIQFVNSREEAPTMQDIVNETVLPKGAIDFCLAGLVRCEILIEDGGRYSINAAMPTTARAVLASIWPDLLDGPIPEAKYTTGELRRDIDDILRNFDPYM